MNPQAAHISAMLMHHVSADASETKSLQRIQELLASAANPFSREHYSPGHLTASAIVMENIRGRPRTALIHHARLQRWLQPGGHFEPGETNPALAAAREVFEETGLKCGEPMKLLDVDVHDIPARKNEPKHCHFDLRMLFVVEPGEVIAGDGTTAARWVSREEALSMDLDPGLLRALNKVWR